MKAEKPKASPKPIPPVTMQDERVKNAGKDAFQKAGATSRAKTNIVKSGSMVYGAGKSTLG